LLILLALLICSTHLRTAQAEPPEKNLQEKKNQPTPQHEETSSDPKWMELLSKKFDRAVTQKPGLILMDFHATLLGGGIAVAGHDMILGGSGKRTLDFDTPKGTSPKTVRVGKVVRGAGLSIAGAAFAHAGYQVCSAQVGELPSTEVSTTMLSSNPFSNSKRELNQYERNYLENSLAEAKARAAEAAR
jgi:hypothetical protein